MKTNAQKMKQNYDKLKLVLRYNSSKRPFIVMNPNAFSTTPNGTHKYYDEYIGLSIEYDKIPRFNNNGTQELIIQFSSKILGEHMVELINRDTIMQCFKNINKRNLIALNLSSKLLDDFEVVLADVTMDKHADESFIQEMSDFTMSNFKNHKKNTLKLPRYPQFNIIMENTAKTPKYKKRLTIYDKYAEIQHMQRFQHIPDYIVEQFNRVYRIERNLKTKEQVRTALHIQSNKVSLREVLNATAQPFVEIYQEFVTMGIKQTEEKTMREELMRCFCQIKKYDLVKIEHFLRKKYKSSYNKKIFEPYKQICYEHIRRGATRDYSLAKKIREFLQTPTKINENAHVKLS